MKFFNIDVPDTTATTSQQPSIAQLMAQSGNVRQEGYAAPLEEAQINTETTATEVKTEEPTIDVPSADVPPVETEVPTLSIEPPQEQITEAQTQIETPQAVPTWQEALKQQQPTDVLKVLGFDDTTISLANELKDFEKKDFFLGLLSEWKEKGDVSNYLRQLSTDYAKMSAEEVMRHQLRNDYPKASEKQLELLFETEVVKQYGLDSDDPEEVERGQMLLEAKVDRFRDTLIANQQKYLFPAPSEKTTTVPTVDAQPDATEVAKQAYQSEFENSSFIKGLSQSKSFSIGEGAEAFKVADVDVNSIREILYTDKFAEVISHVERNTDGSVKSVKPNVQMQVLVGTFLKDPFKFLKDYGTHMKSLGSKTLIDVIDNVKPPESGTPSQSETPPTSAAAAMAKQGRWA